MLSNLGTGAVCGPSGLRRGVGCGISCLGVGIGGAFGLVVIHVNSGLGGGVWRRVSCLDGWGVVKIGVSSFGDDAE